MYIIPAIDLIGGKCVRLIQGEYDSQITYQKDPLEQANQFASDGAQWLHIVDLEGAKLGKPVNTTTIARIAELGRLNIEVGGGLGDFAGKIWRVGLMGCSCTKNHVNMLLAALRQIIK